MTDTFNAGQHRACHADVSWLEHHWGSAYKISYRQKQFSAERRDDGQVLTASASLELLDKIAADYAERPVPR